MEAQNPREQLRRLRDELHHHNYLYYILNHPELPDFDFVQKLAKLQSLKAPHPELNDPNSPPKRVGTDLSKDFEQVAYRNPCFLWATLILKASCRILSTALSNWPVRR